MIKWLNLVMGMLAGFVFLTGLYFWVERNDPGQAALLMGCALCVVSLVGNVRLPAACPDAPR
jgi:hypothetical protein